MIKRSKNIANIVGTSMIRMSDMALASLITATTLFFGATMLFGQTVRLNPIKLSTIYIVFFSMLLGSGLGAIAGLFFTQDRLEVLGKKGEWRLKDSKIPIFTGIAGVLVFLLISLLIARTGRPAFALGEIYFVLSAAFTLSVSRMVLVVQFERRTKKFIFMDWWSSRLYITHASTLQQTLES